MQTPGVGDRAPAFEAPAQGGRTVSLSDYDGKKLALYFYPRDYTPGCTRQSCNLRDNAAILAEHGIAVVGVSPDDVASHERFAEKYNLTFPLVADPEKEILNAYGAWGEKNMYGRLVKGVKRTTFLIDERGVIVHVFRRPKVASHAAEILRAFGC